MQNAKTNFQYDQQNKIQIEVVYLRKLTDYATKSQFQTIALHFYLL